MMDSKRDEGSPLRASGVLVVLAALTAWAWQSPQFRNFRPSASALPAHLGVSGERLHARLWQDPFHALLKDSGPRNTAVTKDSSTIERAHVDRQVPNEPLGFDTIDGLGADVRRRSLDRQAEDALLLLLPVFVPGGGYAEQVESRRRRRTAVISGLAAKNYVPEDPERIGAFSWALRPEDLSQPESRDKTRVAYEWYERDSLKFWSPGKRAQHVLVLWIAEDELGDEPLLNLNSLLRAVLTPLDLHLRRDSPGLFENSPEERVLLRLIGPGTSDALATIVEESKLREPKTALSMTEELLDFVDDHLGKRQGPGLPHQQRHELEPDLSRLMAGAPEAAWREGETSLKRLQETAQLIFEHSSVPMKQMVEDVNSLLGTDGPQDISGVDYAKRLTEQLEDELVETFGMPFLERDIERFSDDIRWAFTNLDKFDYYQKGIEAVLREHPGDSKSSGTDSDWIPYVSVRWPLLNRSAGHGAGSMEWLLDDLTIYSNSATAAEALFFPPDDGRVPSRSPSIFDQLRYGYRVRGVSYAPGEKTGPRFFPTLSSDEQLAKSLVMEMKRRGLNVIDEASLDHIVLIGEWDTFYARALPRAIEGEIQNLRSVSDGRDLSRTLQLMFSADVLPPAGVHRFNYFRGLDGAVPGEGSEVERAGETANDEGEPKRQALEQPFGTDQQDTIGRLASSLGRFARQLQNEHGERIGAIGVLGSDVYDKQLVLQALRERFPRAMFFTTGLDARLTHQEQYEWCHNLIVASSHGLELERPIQGAVPPLPRLVPDVHVHCDTLGARRRRCLEIPEQRVSRAGW